MEKRFGKIFISERLEIIQNTSESWKESGRTNKTHRHSYFSENSNFFYWYEKLIKKRNNNINNNRHFKRLISNISHEKTWAWLRKGNLKRETESFLIAAQNNVIRTNQMKARKDKTQQNNKCSIYGDRDETINHNKRMRQISTEGV